MDRQPCHPAAGYPTGKSHRISLALIFFFLLLLLAGIGWGEPDRVLEQARLICLACIGIG